MSLTLFGAWAVRLAICAFMLKYLQNVDMECGSAILHARHVRFTSRI
jgi:hypothetical protein